MLNYNKEKLIYLAGIIDGEGHFYKPACISGHKSKYRQARIVISNTSKELIDWCAKFSIVEGFDMEKNVFFYSNMTKLSGSISIPENMVEKILIKLLELLKKQILAFYIGMNIGRHILYL